MTLYPFFSITLSSFIVTIVKLEHLSSPHIILGMTCKVRTGKQNIPFLFLVIDNCSHFSSDELIKPRQRYKKIFNISFVLNKKVLILFNTMDKMNKISTFVPHLSVIQHLFPHFTGNDNSLYATMNRSLV